MDCIVRAGPGDSEGIAAVQDCPHRRFPRWQEAPRCLSPEGGCCETEGSAIYSEAGSGCWVPRWEAPESGWAKLNTDAGFEVNSGVACAGGVLRNCRGEVLLSSWTKLQACASPEEAEILACGLGLRLAMQWSNMPLIRRLC